MRESVALHVGGAGVRLGGAWWSLLGVEHGLAPPTPALHAGQVWASDDAPVTLFNLSQGGRCTPRALLLDTEPSVIDEVQQSDFGGLFPPDQLLKGNEDAGGCYARAFYRSSVDVQTVMERVRKMTEACEGLEGFLLFHSLGGGTGAGLTAAIVEQLTMEYPRRTKISFALHPSTRYLQSAVQPYNSVLATHATMSDIDCTFLFDNDAVVDMCSVQGKIRHLNLNDLNSFIAQVMSAITLGLRTSLGAVLTTLQEFPVNLVPFPRLHFPLVSYAPVVGVRQRHEPAVDATTLALSCLDAANHVMKCDPRRGLYAVLCFLYRGDVTPVDVNKAVTSIKANRTLDFTNWSPAGLKIGINPKGPHASPRQHCFGVPRSALCALAANSAIAEVWGALMHTFDRLFAKKAFLHWYLGEGMEEQQFVKARNDLAALENEYRELFASTFSGGGGGASTSDDYMQL